MAAASSSGWLPYATAASTSARVQRRPVSTGHPDVAYCLRRDAAGCCNARFEGHMPPLNFFLLGNSNVISFWNELLCCVQYDCSGCCNCNCCRLRLLFFFQCLLSICEPITTWPDGKRGCSMCIDDVERPNGLLLLTALLLPRSARDSS